MRSVLSVRPFPLCLNQLTFNLNFCMFMGYVHSSRGLKVKIICQGRRPVQECAKHDLLRLPMSTDGE